MILRRVNVQNFRSIVDSGSVDIEEGITVLIGKNEQGKTNFLKALTSFNQDPVYSPSDLPNHLRPSLEEKTTKDIPIVTLWFTLNPEDRTALKAIVEDIDDIKDLKATKFYDGSYQFSISKGDLVDQPLQFARPDTSTEEQKIKEAAKALQTKLAVHTERLPEFATSKDKIDQLTESLLSANFAQVGQLKDVVQTFSAALKGLPGQDQAIQEDITATGRDIETHLTAIQKIHASDKRTAFIASLPIFILHSARVDQIPNAVPVSQFTADPEGTSRGMLNLCRAAGLSLQKIQQLAATKDTAQREVYEDYYKGTISGGLNEFWNQETYHVHFRIETDRLSVSISDETYSQRIPPLDRGEGFQWYLSFYSTLLSELVAHKKTILLFDNPGLELHVDGQRDIKHFLEEKVTFDSQVVYVTHSPAMVDPFNLAQLRKVVLLPDNEGTKVLNSVSQEGDAFDLLEPVRTAIGASLVSSLIVNDFNVLVEGAADKPILEGAFAALHRDEKHQVLVNGSLAQSKDCILARFYARTKLPFVVLLDADSRGRELKEELKKWGIPDAQIILLDDVIHRKGEDFALEDILSTDFYHEAVVQTYFGHTVNKPPSPAGKRATAYESALQGIHFSKKKVADTVKKLLEKPDVDKETTDNLAEVTSAILKNLASQTSEIPHNKNAPPHEVTG